MRHLSIMGGLIVAGYGVEQLLARYGLLLDPGTLFTGVHYTDDHASMNAKLVVAVAAFIVAALFFVNAVVNRTYIPVAGVVLMLVSGLILSLLYPAAIQTFSVKPNEPDKEGPYISAHMKMTKEAYGLTDVDIVEYEAVTKVRPGQLREDAAALPGIRLMDPDVIGPTFDQLQQVRGYYAFPKVLDVNRYNVDGKDTDVVVAARELDMKGIPDRNWNNLHTVFTHGHGLVTAYGNRRQTLGEPEWITKDIPGGQDRADAVADLPRRAVGQLSSSVVRRARSRSNSTPVGSRRWGTVQRVRRRGRGADGQHVAPAVVRGPVRGREHPAVRPDQLPVEGPVQPDAQGAG